MNDILSTKKNGSLQSDGAAAFGSSPEWSSVATLPSRHTHSGSVLAKRGSGGVIHDPVELLFVQSGSEGILTRDEEQEIARTLVSARQQFLEQLFSCTPIARQAITLLREVLQSGSYCYHENILDIAGNEDKREIVATVAKAKLISKQRNFCWIDAKCFGLRMMAHQTFST